MPKDAAGSIAWASSDKHLVRVKIDRLLAVVPANMQLFQSSLEFFNDVRDLKPESE